MTVPKTMQTGIYYQHDDIRMEERPVPAIGPAEVLAEVNACGICGSDIMRWYRNPVALERGGINTGHEIAGRIVKLGAEVTGFFVGDRIVITHHFPCLECTACQDGNETACEAMHQKHIEPGGFAQYVRILESGLKKGLYRLPEMMSYEEGSFVEPLACVVRSLRKAGPMQDRSVLVIGSGLAGLLHIRLARVLGAAWIHAVDTNEDRLVAAGQSGADEVHLANSKLPSADRVFICTGSGVAAKQALQCVSRGGKILFFAADGPDKKLEIPLTQYWLEQPTILFSYGAAPGDMTESLDLIATGRVCVKDLITHRFHLSGFSEALYLAANPRGTSLKIIVNPQAG